MVQTYRVAGHIFQLDIPAEWQVYLNNYTPFLVTDNLSDHPVFQLHVGVCNLSGEKIPFFTDSSDDDMPRIEVSRIASDWLIEESMYKSSPICMHLRTVQDFSEAWLQIDDDNIRFAIDNATMLLFAFTTAKLHTLELHASVVVREGKGYVFLGKSGTGKSTHSKQWQQAFDDVWLLNDDNPIVRLIDDQVMVYGSPWSGKTPCYVNQSAPVAAIVKLSQSPHNQLQPIRLPEAYAYMLSSTSGMKILPDMMDALYDTIASVIQTIRFFSMECLPNKEAAEVCFNGICTHANLVI